LTILLWLVSAVILALFAIFPLEWKSQAELGVLLFAASIILGRISRRHRMTLALIALSIFCSTRYMYWRISETFCVLHSDPGAVPSVMRVRW